MNRRIIIASALLIIGTLVYLSLSRGPMRVQVATVPAQLVYLLSLSYFVWVAPLGPRGRLVALLGTAFVMSALSTYLDSFVIMALRPLHPVYFATGFLGFLVEGLLFIGLTWLTDRGIEMLKIRRRQRADKSAR